VNSSVRSQVRSDDFDPFADDYEQTLGRGLAVSGEGSQYFAEGRVAFLAQRLRALGVRPRTALDFGCGTGSSAPFLLGTLELESLVGVDVSRRSVAVAARHHGGDRTRFVPLDDHEPGADIDLAFCNGVFHHIPPIERGDAVAHVFRSLRPGGLWALWENNPYNPGTRWIMSRLAFDRDAITLAAGEAKRLVEAGGFEVLSVDHLFLFPAFLRPLRVLEPRLAHLPLGAQYQVLCRKRS
jgi:SAM-dependent methyltransferase